MIENTDVVLEEIQQKTPENGDEFDVIIIGAGPAGMSAATCIRRGGLSTLVIEQALPGGQASTAYHIDNYLGFSDGIFGDTLGREMEAQMRKQDHFYTCEMVEDIIEGPENIKIVRTELNHEYRGKAIVIATGLNPKTLNTNFEKSFLGRGVSYYAQGDIDEYKGADVAVIGGGNCACYAADFLSNHVNQLYLIHKSDQIKAVNQLREKVLKNPKIHLLWNSEISDIFGIDKVEKLKIHNSTTNQHTWINVKGVFIYIGRVPSNQLLHIDLKTNEEGYIITDEYMRTNIPGIYAVGDIRTKQIRQIATAVSDGMVAAINIERDLFR